MPKNLKRKSESKHNDTPEKSLNKKKQTAAIAAEGDAKREVLEEILADVYHMRPKIYTFNFVRGIFFGFGSVLGGTVLVAVLVWVLSQFVDWFPLFGEFINGIIDAMSNRR